MSDKPKSETTNDIKRQNFNVTPEQETELQDLREALDASSVKDAILRSARIIAALAREARRGHALYLGTEGGAMTRLLIPELEPPDTDRRQYLVERSHPWRRQLSVKGRKLLASTVWREMQVNGLTVTEAADNWSLPAEAIAEIVSYCESHRDLLALEAEEERRRLESRGVALEPRTAPAPRREALA